MVRELLVPADRDSLIEQLVSINSLCVGRVAGGLMGGVGLVFIADHSHVVTLECGGVQKR